MVCPSTNPQSCDQTRMLTLGVGWGVQQRLMYVLVKKCVQNILLSKLYVRTIATITLRFYGSEFENIKILTKYSEGSEIAAKQLHCKCPSDEIFRG